MNNTRDPNRAVYVWTMIGSGTIKNVCVDNVLRVCIGYASQLFVSPLPHAQPHPHHNDHAMVCLIVVACALELVLCAHQALLHFDMDEKDVNDHVDVMEADAAL